MSSSYVLMSLLGLLCFETPCFETLFQNAFLNTIILDCFQEIIPNEKENEILKSGWKNWLKLDRRRYQGNIFDIQFCVDGAGF